LRNGDQLTVQFSDKNYTDAILSRLNELCAKYDTNFCVRFYGYYSSKIFDFEELRKIPNVKCLYVDCLTKAKNIQALSELANLKELSLGIYELEDTEVLRYDNLKNLISLSVGEAKTKALNLKYLENLTELKSLVIAGHNKNINSIEKLFRLEHLRLHALKNTALDFVNSLGKLKTLTLQLGGRENIREIGENEIEELKIIWVRGFSDIDNISNFKKLKKLWLEDNIKLSSIRFDQKFEYLEELSIFNCKTLSTLEGLENLTALKTLSVSRTNLDFEDILKQKLPKTLETFDIWEKAGSKLQKQIAALGYKTSIS
jgi:Leucine-rich repeat (LRR) protein